MIETLPASISKCILIYFVILCSTAAISQTPTITSLGNSQAIVGNPLIITGTNFSATSSNNIVYFGGVRATVTAATTTQLTITVPSGGTPGPITITVGGKTTSYGLPPDITFPSNNVLKLSSQFTVSMAGTPTGYGLGIGDFDGDGLSDVAVPETNTSYMWVGRNTSTQGTPSISPSALPSAGGQSNYVTVGDLDGDGKLDAVQTNTYATSVSIYKNTSTNGVISFASKIDLTTGTTPASTVIGDLDGDGLQEIITYNSGANTISIFKNNSTPGTISFSPKADFNVTNFYSLKIADLDVDGKLDLVSIGNVASYSICVLRNASTVGNISFDVQKNFSKTGNSGSAVGDIGDLNFDGKPDIVMGDASATKISVYKNTSTQGTVSFSTQVDISVTGYPGGIAIADLDGDGSRDIASLATTGDVISTIKNTTSPLNASLLSFATLVDFPISFGYYNPSSQLRAVDYDGNGKLDLVFTGGSAYNFGVLLNNTKKDQTLTFNSPASVNIGYGTAPYSLIAGASSGLPVSYSSLNTSVASVNANGQVTTTGVGTTTITISQPGDNTYNAAPTSYTQTVNVAPIAIQVSGVTVANKVYDGNAIGTISGPGVLGPGVINGDAVTLVTANADATFNSKNAGQSKPLTITGYSLSGAKASNYVITQPTYVTANITPKSLSISYLTVSDKVYDGSNSAVISNNGTLTGVISPDNVTLIAGIAQFQTAYVGNLKSLILSSFALGGVDGANYTLSMPSVTASITPKSVTISNTTVGIKPYDGSVTATVANIGGINGLYGGDTGFGLVTIQPGTATFADKNVGVNKTVTFSGFALSGPLAYNYTLASQPSPAFGTISVRSMSILGTNASNKVYDGKTATAINSYGTLDNALLVPGDVLNINTTNAKADFSNKNVGTNKTVTFSGFALSGADAANYSLSGQPPSLLRDISPLPVTIAGITANSVTGSKEYDGSTSIGYFANGGFLVGTVPTDNIFLGINNVIASYVDKNVGVAKPVTWSGFSLYGVDAGNYTLSQPPNVVADITPKYVTITGVTVNNKVYDRTTAATFSAQNAVVLGALPQDGVTVNSTNATAVFNDKFVGNQKPVGFLGFTLGGVNSSNYSLINQPSATASITPRAVSVTGLTADNKVYDGSTDATWTGGSLNGVLNGDNVSLDFSNVGAFFASKVAATAKSVTVTGFSLSGSDWSNYYFPNPSLFLLADITKKPISISGGLFADKTYDGTLNATVTGNPVFNGLVPGDVVGIDLANAVANFSDVKVGTGKAVTISSYTLTDIDGGNYSPLNSTVNADITPMQITISADGSGKPYGSNDPVLTYVSTPALLGGDSFTGVLSRSAGEAIGQYWMNQGSLSAGNNYAINFNPALFTISVGNQTITFNALSDRNVNDLPFTIDATSDSGLPVSFALAMGSPATLLGNTITLTGVPGTVTVVASQLGDANYNAAVDVQRSFDVNLNPNATLTFNNFSTIYGAAPFAPTATSNSTGAITFQILGGGTGNAGVSNGLITPLMPGTVNVRAIVASDANWTGVYKDAVLTIGKAPQAIPSPNLSNSYTVNDADVTLPAFTDANLPVTYSSSDLSIANIINGNTLHFVGSTTGPVTISSVQLGDLYYLSASPVQTTIYVRATQTISFGALNSKIFGDAAFALNAIASSGLSVSYASSNPNVATINGNTVTIVGAGTTNITASQAGNNNYNAAINVAQPLIVNKGNQSITFNSLTSKNVGDAAITLSGVASSGLGITYASSNTSVATVSGNTVTIVGVGTTTITASQAGDTNYNAATDVAQPLAVNKGNQTIAFAALAAKNFGDAAFQLTATGGGSDKPVTFASSNASVATVSGNTVTIVGAGTTTLTASQAGNNNYNAATDVAQPLTVNKASQTITFAALSSKNQGDAAFNISATSSSGLAVSYSIGSGPATISANTVTLTGAGSVMIKASQAGNTNYSAATDVSQTFCVNPSKPTISASFANSETPVLTSSSTTGNQWYLGGNAISNATNATCTVPPTASNGSYSVKVTIGGCSSVMSDPSAIVVTGDILPVGSIELLVYPNPAEEEIQINFGQAEKVQQVGIYNEQGVAMQTGGKEMIGKSLPIRSYASGLYLVRVRYSNSMIVGKFMKK